MKWAKSIKGMNFMVFNTKKLNILLKQKFNNNTRKQALNESTFLGIKNGDNSSLKDVLDFLDKCITHIISYNGIESLRS